MKSENLFFIESLENLKPSIDSFMKLGLSEDEAIDFSKSFSAIKRETEIPLDFHSDISEIFSIYIFGNLVMGMVDFCDKPLKSTTDRVNIGKVEADPLIQNITNNSIAVYDIFSNELIWECAASGRQFLESMLCFHKANIENLQSDIFDENKMEIIAGKCANIAGDHDRYISFYLMLFGL